MILLVARLLLSYREFSLVVFPPDSSILRGKKNKTEDTPVTLALQDLKNMQVKGVNPLNTPDNHLQQYAEWILHAYNSNKIDLNSIPES